jgi:hypothetical protein
MRRNIRIPLVMFLLAVVASLALAGCGTTAVKVGNSGTKPTTGTSQENVSSHVPTEAEVGVPVYPGARLNENESMAFTNSNGQKTYSVARLWTTDPIPTVTSWYQQQLSGKTDFKQLAAETTAAGTATIFTWSESGKIKMVTVGPGVIEMKGKTVIAVGAG